MRDGERRIGDGWWIGLLLVVAASAVMAWVWVPAGRATSDSASYLDGARHLAAGEGYTSSYVGIGSTGLRPIVDFGPGLPLLMVPGIRDGLDARRSAALVLASSYVLYATAIYLLLLEVAGRRWWALVFLLSAVLIIHPGALLLLDTIGSDLPAAAFGVCAAYFGARLLRKSEPDIATAVGAALCMSLALLVRWSMLYLLIAFSCALLISLPRTWSWKRRSYLTGVVLLVPLCTIVPWIVRNYMTTRTLVGYRHLRFADPLRIATDALTGIGSGVFTGDVRTGSMLMRQAVTGLFLLMLVYVLATRGGWRSAVVRLSFVSAAGYTLLLVVSASMSPIDSLSAPRFWLPVWPLLAATAMGSLVAIGARDATGKAMLLVFLAQVLLNGGQFAVDVRRAIPEARSGRGYFRSGLAQSAPMRFVAHNDAVCTLFSNDPRVVLMYQGVARIHDLPDSSEVLRAWLESSDVCIVLFTEPITSRIAAQLAARRRLLQALENERLLTRFDADQVGEVWFSANFPR